MKRMYKEEKIRQAKNINKGYNSKIIENIELNSTSS